MSREALIDGAIVIVLAIAWTILRYLPNRAAAIRTRDRLTALRSERGRTPAAGERPDPVAALSDVVLDEDSKGADDGESEGVEDAPPAAELPGGASDPVQRTTAGEAEPLS